MPAGGVQSKPSDTERAPNKARPWLRETAAGLLSGFTRDDSPRLRLLPHGPPSSRRGALTNEEEAVSRGGKRRGAEGTWGKYAFGGLGLSFHHEPVGRPRAQGPAPGCPCEPADWSARPSSRAFGARAHFSGSRVLRGRPLLKKRERSLKTAFFFSLQDDREENNPRLRVGGEPLEIKARRPCSRGNSRGGGRLGVDLRVKLAKGHGRREATWRLSRSHERVNPRETSPPKSAGPGGAFG